MNNAIICPANCEFKDCIHAQPHKPYQTGTGQHCDEVDTICLSFTGRCQPFPVYTERVHYLNGIK